MPVQPTSQGKDVNERRSGTNGDTWFAAGLALATVTLVQCSSHLSVLAAEKAIQKSEPAEAALRAPAWLTPALLACAGSRGSNPEIGTGRGSIKSPCMAHPSLTRLSSAIFNVYRDQVNPSAKVMDWMFGVAAVLISMIGVGCTDLWLLS